MQEMWIQIAELGLLPLGLAIGFAMGRRITRDEAEITTFAAAPAELGDRAATDAGVDALAEGRAA